MPLSTTRPFAFLLLLAALSLAGCDSLLEENPRGRLTASNFFNSTKEADQAVLGLYRGIRGYRFYFRDQHALFGDWGTDLTYLTGGRPKNGRYFWLFNYTMDANNTQELRIDWRRYYEVVADANMTIDRVSAMEDGTIAPEQRAELVGEARFVRALVYYHLANAWGDVPLWLNELELSEVSALPRAPLAEVRAQILDDLSAAEEVLPAARPAARDRATKWAAMTLRTKVLLQEERWDEAAATAREIIDGSPYRLLDDYCQVVDMDQPFNDEVIFAIDWVSEQLPSRMSRYFLPRQQDEPSIEGVNLHGYGMHAVYPTFAESYAEEDKRRPCTLASEVNGVELNHTFLLKYGALDAPFDNGPRFTVFRLADVYLLLAEAELGESAPTAAAYEAINAVRARAGLPPLEDGLSEDAFREALLQERAWELVGEGKRRQDLVRNEMLVETVRAHATDLHDGAANIEPHHRRFPLPQGLLDVNPNLEQTEGY